MTLLVADQLKEMWESVEENRLTSEHSTLQQGELNTSEREVCTRALVLDGHADFQERLLAELDAYFHVGPWLCRSVAR